MKPEQMPTNESIELAAQAWCDPTVSDRVMDGDLAIAFARIIDKVRLPKRLTPEEADAAFDDAPEMPMTAEEIAAIVDDVTSRKHEPTESAFDWMDEDERFK